MRAGRLVSISVLLAASCAHGADPTGETQRSERVPTSASASTVAPARSPSTTPTTGVPVFDATVQTIADPARLAHSWRPGCPVPLEDLRLLALDHWGYDGAEHRGELVVHADYADAMVAAFRSLFAVRFPIERLQLVDAYGGDDHASTLANNTAAFNCRAVVGAPGVWSEHAFGRAIDVNPRVNPYLLDPRLDHPTLAPFVDRSRQDPGMIRAGDSAVQAFAAVGWHWGGA